LTPTISVVLPTRNGARTIARQLEALARQSCAEPWELLIVDNGSTDETRQIAEGFRDRIAGLRLVDASARPGIPYVCNVGISAANSDLIAVCNDDDEVDPGWVEAMRAALEEHELVTGRLEHDRLNEPWVVAVRGRPQADGPLFWSFGTHLPFGAGATLGVRRSLHDRIGGFDEAMTPAGEDMDYCWRAQYAGAALRFVPDAVTHYAFRADLREIYRQGRSYGQGNVVAYRKHRPLGLPPVPSPLRTAIGAWLAIVKNGLLAADKVRRGRFVWYLGWRVGMLEYSLKYRTMLL
jgi:glycosyltransferase involved in cell wall biosynthesis